ncbi:MAG: FAD-binding oxidoreductase [Planctomycetes bacterium]|nr:FAD-binding oxidoreductase [Planctomycetota bacterium]
MNATFAPERVEEVAHWLRQRPGRVRVVGGGSRQHELPDCDGAARLGLGRLSAIERLDPGDLTCTVLPGLERRELDAALAGHGLELPCLGEGTLGGLFASDPVGPAAHGAGNPRGLLLGCDAVLADGTPFKAGARVVKSVAGFDVHKLLVGSRGTLFVATRLHLRLQARPRAVRWVERDELAIDEALRLCRALRELPAAPDVLALRRSDGGAYAVCARLVGRTRLVDAAATQLALQDREPGAPLPLPSPATGEVVRGLALPSALAGLCGALPARGAFAWLGGGRFEACSPDPTTTDRLLAWCTANGCPATIVAGPASRRGRGTPLDPGEARLAHGLRTALDPDGILA